MAKAPDKTPAREPAAREETPAAPSASQDIAAFLDKARSVAPRTGGDRGRLVFALDATMSRQPTWDLALELQAQMFDETARIGGLEVQLVYYRGFGECRASRWVDDARSLKDLMAGIACRGGQTQIMKVLGHARRETGRRRVQAVVFVGDAMEEDVDRLAQTAGELGLLKVPVFIFQEGRDLAVERAFREIARLSGGAYARFDRNSAGELATLLRAVAAYAAGGIAALADLRGSGARLLLQQMR